MFHRRRGGEVARIITGLLGRRDDVPTPCNKYVIQIPQLLPDYGYVYDRVGTTHILQSGKDLHPGPLFKHAMRQRLLESQSNNLSDRL